MPVKRHNDLDEDEIQAVKQEACRAYQEGDDRNPYPLYSEAWEIWDTKYTQALNYFED